MKATPQILYSFVINTSIFLAFSAACLSFAMSLLLGYKTEMIFHVAIFLLYFSIYNLNKTTDKNEDKINHPSRDEVQSIVGREILFLSILFGIASLLIFAQKGFITLFVSLIPLFAVIVYSIPWIPQPLSSILKAKRLKDIIIVKSLMVVLSWASSMILLQAVFDGNPIDQNLFIVSLILLPMLFINSVVFDMRDTKGDKQAGVETIPVRIGVVNTKKVLVATNTCLGVYVFFSAFFGLTYEVGLFVLLNTMYTYVYLFLCEWVNPNFVCDVLVDGEYILLALVLLLGRTLTG